LYAAQETIKILALRVIHGARVYNWDQLITRRKDKSLNILGLEGDITWSWTVQLQVP